jgi:DNA polymerase-3 subunit beta
MKFTCEKSTLIKEIVIAQEIASAKQPINVFCNIYLEAADNSLMIKAADMNVYFHTRVPVSVQEPGKIMVKGDTFLGILNGFSDGEIEFENNDVKMIIKLVDSGKNKVKEKFNIRTMLTDQFPEFEISDDALNFELPLEDFKDMIRNTIFSISDDQTRYFMNGVFFEKTENKFTMVATDGRRMAYAGKEIDITVDSFKGIIIPEKVLNLVLKYSSNEGNIQVCVKENYIFFSFGSLHFYSKLIEGQFPNYSRVIPESLQYEFIVDRQSVLAALKRVALLVEKKNKRVVFKLTTGKLEIITDDSETGSAQVEIESNYDGEDAEIAFNYEFIEDPLKNITENEVSFKFTNTAKAIMLKSVPESFFFHVLMPMQS